jgi:hypothetical protein
MAMALALLGLGETRDLWLYDTFEGMTPPTERDGGEFEAWDPAGATMRGASLDVVTDAMRSTGYPMDRIRFVKGRVEDTVPSRVPDRVAVLRLDTDWYESTKHELQHLYPLLGVGGLLLIDDYGHCEGARRAVDEYFADAPVYLARHDYAGRVAVKR